MQDNIGKTGSNWTSSPRTLRDAFPQYPGSAYEEPSTADKILDVIVVVGTMALCAYGVYLAVALLGG